MSAVARGSPWVGMLLSLTLRSSVKLTVPAIARLRLPGTFGFMIIAAPTAE